MHKIIFVLSLFLFPLVSFCQTPDTVLYGTAKFTTYDKFDKKPEPSFKLDKFLVKNLRYPDEARERNIQGRVYVQFTIEENGKVTKPTIVSSPHQSLSDETIRILGLMPAWTPAMKDGKPISVTLTMPLVFKLG